MTDTQSGITPEMIADLVPFARFLNIAFPVLTSTQVIARLPFQDGYRTIGGGVHGGAQMALADITAAVMAVLANGDPSSAPATMQSSTNFLEAAHGDLTATAAVLRHGRSAVIDVVITDETGTVTATVRQVVAVRATR